MKKVFILIMVLLLVAMAAVLASCGDTSSGGNSDTSVKEETEEIAGTLKINVREDDGSKRVVGVDEDADVASYRIICDDGASDAVKDVALGIRAAILDKTGADIEIKADATGADKAIVVLLDGEMGADDFSLTSEDGKIYVKAGSEESLSKAASVFTGSFIYGSRKSLLVPAGKGYVYAVSYPFDKITVDGVDISCFKLYADPAGSISIAPDIYPVMTDIGEIINKNLLGAIGTALEETTELVDGNNYIIVNSGSTNVNEYSIKIENGNIYLNGSYASVKVAAEKLMTELIGYEEGANESGKTADIAEGASLRGSAGITVPYTKAELYNMLEYAYENDEMILSGSHVWDESGNGKNIRKTENTFTEKGLGIPVILELDITSFSPLCPRTGGVDRLNDYTLSQIVSEAMRHASEGGVISICCHFVNPTGDFPDGVWYRGKVGGEAGVTQMLTKGTDMNKALHDSIDGTIRLAKALNDNGIPFLLRPFHEMTGDWFWWCIAGNNITRDALVSLWKYFYNEVTVVNGVTEALWVYSPSTNSTLTNYCKVDIMHPYPGDEYVDIVGMDGYIGGVKEPKYNENDGWDKLEATGKPVALTEWGPANSVAKKDASGDTYYDYSCEEALEELKTIINNGHRIAYFEVWTREYSVCNLDDPEILMNDPLIYTRDEMASYWEND